MIEIFDLPLGANETREADISGEYFELRNALHPIALIELLDRTGGVVSLLRNPEQSDFVRPGKYERIRITNGPTAQTVRHFYGSGDAGSRRTSGLVKVEGVVQTMGDVSVIDGAKSRTIANRAFAGTSNITAGAGALGAVYFANPAGSGKRVVVNGIYLGSGTAQNLHVSTGSGVPPGTAAVAGGSKLAGSGVNSTATKYDVTTSAAAPAGGVVLAPTVQANATLVLPVSEPLVLDPGRWIAFSCTVAATTLACGVQFIEEPI